MILNLLRRSLRVGCYLAVLSLLVILIIFLGKGGISKSNDILAIKQKLYECGSFGNKKIRIDRKYLFLGRVEYQNVNYWGKDYKKNHETKGCMDQIQSASFTVKWPEMLPSEGFHLDSKKLNNITISLSQRSAWPVENESKNFFDATPSLIIYLRDLSNEKKISVEQINSQKVFNSNLGLYQIDIKGIGRVSQRVFWQEVEGKGVSIIINCIYFTDTAECELTNHVSNYGFNTSYLSILFHAELLPYWEVLQHDSLKLINSFNVLEK